MSKKELQKLFLIFIAWKLVMLVFSNLAQLIIPLQTTFLGGGLLNYLRHPNFWGLINFDGEHYLSIARDGYLPLTHFYFPMYPVVIKILAGILGNSFTAYAFSGLMLSNIFLFLAIVGLYKLIEENVILVSEYQRAHPESDSGQALRQAQGYARMTEIHPGSRQTGLSQAGMTTILLLLFFPTSFFLQSYYNESLFLALAVWSFYFAIDKKWWIAIVLSVLASATRVVGIALAVGIVVEYLYEGRRIIEFSLLKERTCKVVKSAVVGILSTAGLFLYMGYLHIKTGSVFEFFKNVSIFGEQRSTSLVSLPQVLYRYFFKILPNVDYNYFPAVFTAYLEIIIALLFVLIIGIMFFKSRASFFVYSLLAFLIPSLSGSFSSMPRYVLVIFPAFILMGEFLLNKNRTFRYIIYSLLLLISLFSVSLFIRGYFVS